MAVAVDHYADDNAVFRRPFICIVVVVVAVSRTVWSLLPHSLFLASSPPFSRARTRLAAMLLRRCYAPLGRARALRPLAPTLQRALATKPVELPPFETLDQLQRQSCEAFADRNVFGEDAAAACLPAPRVQKESGRERGKGTAAVARDSGAIAATNHSGSRHCLFPHGAAFLVQPPACASLARVWRCLRCCLRRRTLPLHPSAAADVHDPCFPPFRVAKGYRRGGGSYHWITYRDLARRVDHYEGLLRSVGVIAGDRIGLICANRWVAASAGWHWTKTVCAVAAPLCPHCAAAPLRRLARRSC